MSSIASMASGRKPCSFSKALRRSALGWPRFLWHLNHTSLSCADKLRNRGPCWRLLTSQMIRSWPISFWLPVSRSSMLLAEDLLCCTGEFSGLGTAMGLCANTVILSRAWHPDRINCVLGKTPHSSQSLVTRFFPVERCAKMVFLQGASADFRSAGGSWRRSAPLQVMAHQICLSGNHFWSRDPKGVPHPQTNDCSLAVRMPMAQDTPTTAPPGLPEPDVFSRR